MMSALRVREGERVGQNVTMVLIIWGMGQRQGWRGSKIKKNCGSLFSIDPRALPPDDFEIQDEKKLDMPFGLKEFLFLIFARFFHFIPSSCYTSTTMGIVPSHKEAA